MVMGFIPFVGSAVGAGINLYFIRKSKKLPKSGAVLRLYNKFLIEDLFYAIR